MPNRTVTGTFPQYAVATVTFALEALFVDAGAIYPTFSTSVTTDAEGDFSVSLPVPTTDAAAYVVALPGTKRNVHFTLGAGATIGLDVIIASASTTMTVDAIQELLADYQADITAQLAASAAAVNVATAAQIATMTAALALRVPLAALSWFDDNAAYFVAPEAMTFNTPTVAGTGTVTYDKALAATPTVFTSASLPVTLATGDVLRITVVGVVGYKALTLRRTT